MSRNITGLKSSIIISVYNDCTALQLILDSLHHQSSNDFEIIISEDGESELIKECINNYSDSPIHIRHLTQEDSGFRKNIALNRAISITDADHIIFIDGDCIPHTEFIAAHHLCSGHGIACTGRRLELGASISNKLRSRHINLSYLTNPLLYLLHMLPLQRDNAKNIESGMHSKWLHKLTRDKEIRLLGCNFSCNKQDLLKINGFNEDYLSPGIGEDSDIDWRLIKSGVVIKNVKFSAIQYHLNHPRSYVVSKENTELFEQTKRSNTYTCDHGIR